MIKSYLKFAILIVSVIGLNACSYYDHHLFEEGEYNFKNHNYHLAFLQLFPLADHGNAEAQYAVGYMYFYGQGVTENIKAAHEWISRSAAQHYPPAMAAEGMVTEKLAASLAAAKPVAIKDRRYWVS